MPNAASPCLLWQVLKTHFVTMATPIYNIDGKCHIKRPEGCRNCLVGNSVPFHVCSLGRGYIHKHTCILKLQTIATMHALVYNWVTIFNGQIIFYQDQDIMYNEIKWNCSIW